MTSLATIGIRIQVTPWDDIYMRTEHSSFYIGDRTPFDFRVEGWFEDGQEFYGLYGPVISGPSLYQNLICNIFVRADRTDWKVSSKCQANFKVGLFRATRCHAEDFRHPDGTEVAGFPTISRYGEVCTVTE